MQKVEIKTYASGFMVRSRIHAVHHGANITLCGFTLTNERRYENPGGCATTCTACLKVIQGFNAKHPSVEELIKDPVNNPAHYTSGKIEVIDFIEDQKLNFPRGNAVKYIARAGKKDPAKEVEDLEKAVWYLNRDIQALKNK